MKKKLIVLGSVFGLMPLLALAQSGSTCFGGTGSATSGGGGGSTSTLFDILCRIDGLLSAVVPLIIAIGVIYFIWGVVTYVIASDEEAKKSGRNRIIYGIIGLVVIVGMWGLVRIVGTTFGTNGATTVVLPTINTSGQQ
jgi:hypothetical protein